MLYIRRVTCPIGVCSVYRNDPVATRLSQREPTRSSRGTLVVFPVSTIFARHLGLHQKVSNLKLVVAMEVMLEGVMGHPETVQGMAARTGTRTELLGWMRYDLLIDVFMFVFCRMGLVRSHQVQIFPCSPYFIHIHKHSLTFIGIHQPADIRAIDRRTHSFIGAMFSKMNAMFESVLDNDDITNNYTNFTQSVLTFRHSLLSDVLDPIVLIKIHS